MSFLLNVTEWKYFLICPKWRTCLNPADVTAVWAVRSEFMKFVLSLSVSSSLVSKKQILRIRPMVQSVSVMSVMLLNLMMDCSVCQQHACCWSVSDTKINVNSEQSKSLSENPQIEAVTKLYYLSEQLTDGVISNTFKWLTTDACWVPQLASPALSAKQTITYKHTEY